MVYAYQNLVHEADRGLVRRKTVLIHQSQDCAPNRRGQTSSADRIPAALGVQDEVIADGADVGVSSSANVVDAITHIAKVRSRCLIPSEVECDLVKIISNGAGLPRRRVEVVAETTTGREACSGALGECCRAVAHGVELRAADREHVWACSVRVWVKDGALRARTTRSVAKVALIAPHAVVARGHDDRGALQAQLHDLVALALKVVCGQIALAATIRYGDDVGGLVDAALQLALVAVGVRVGWVEAFRGSAVAGLAVGAVGAVAAVDGVEESVVETEVGRVEGRLVDLVVLIVGLEENRALRPDEGPRCHEVEVRLHTSIIFINAGLFDGTHRAINESVFGVRAVGDIRVESAEERVQIVLAVVIVERLKDTQLIARGCEGIVGNTVLRPHASSRDKGIAIFRSKNRSVEPGNRGQGLSLAGESRVRRLERPFHGLAFVLHLLELPRVGAHFDARGDVVDVFLDVLGQMIFIHGDVLGSGHGVFKDVEVGDHDLLDFVGLRVKLNPLLVGGEREALARDAARHQPVQNLWNSRSTKRFALTC